MPRPVRVLLTGASGFLGHHLEAALRARPRVQATTAGRRLADVALDLADPAAVAATLAAAPPDLVLHAAALSTIAACDADPALAERVNVAATAALCAAVPRVVLVSTDLVFGGDRAPYRATDPPDPRSRYGASKAAAEAHVLRTAAGLVVRLPLLFGPSFDGRRGATDMLRAAHADGRAVTLFTDEFRTPLHVADAARALVELALDAGGRTGIVHAAGAERVSRFELGARFLARHPLPGLAVHPGERGDPRRPRDVSLATDWPGARPLDAALAAS